MTVELGQPIAYGRTSEIYAWHEAEVLKLFYPWFALEDIESEARISRAIHASGLPTPSVGEVLQINDRHGLVYGRIHGRSMWQVFQKKPWTAFHYAHRWAELHAGIHATKIACDLPLQRHVLGRNIQLAEALPDRLRKKIIGELENLPDGESLCHGDFWPGNILITSRGEIIIDWLHAAWGNPLADLARSMNLVLGFMKTHQSKRPFLSYGTSKFVNVKNSLLQAFCNLCYPVYIGHYFKLCPGDREEYLRWLPIVAAARLSDNIPELENMLLAQVEKAT